MSNWPVMRGGRVAAPFDDVEYPGLTGAAPSAVNTLTGWTQVTAGLSAPAEGIELAVSANGADNGFRALVDIGVGAAGSEVVLVSGILFGASPYREGPSLARFPVKVPANARVAVRWQSSAIVSSGSGGAALAYGMRFLGPSPAYPMGGRISTHGVNAAQTRGVTTSILYGDPQPATELIGSTPAPARGLIIRQAHNPEVSLPAIDVAMRVFLGAAGAEVPIQQWVRTQLFAQDTVLWTPIPQGSRVSVRYRQNTSTDALSVVAYLIH